MVARALIRNTASSPLGLPAPYRGILPPGIGIVVDRTPEQVRADLGGEQFRGGLEITLVQNTKADPFWYTPPALPGGLEVYSEDFTAAATVVVNHNFGRQPSSVSVRNTAGQEIDVAVRYVSENQLQLDFDMPASGTVEVT